MQLNIKFYQFSRISSWDTMFTKFWRRTDRHFLKKVESCSGHLKTHYKILMLNLESYSVLNWNKRFTLRIETMRITNNTVPWKCNLRRNIQPLAENIGSFPSSLVRIMKWSALIFLKIEEQQITQKIKNNIFQRTVRWYHLSKL